MVESHSAPPPPDRSQWQNVLNESWPLVDDNGKRHARGIPNRDPITVLVRIVFERDGEMWVTGQACRWHGRSVYCEVHDNRLMIGGVWVDASDVRRI